MYDYRGAVHLHSTYSDGHGSVDEIMQCANDAALDFVILTDHDTMKPLDDGCEKWHGSTLLICGVEVTPRNNHYIAFGEKRLDGVENLAKLAPQEYIDAMNKQNWIGFIAHPDHEGAKRFDVQSYKWLDWSVDRFGGMGIWDLMSDWLERIDGPDITMEAYTDFAHWLTGPKKVTLERWDEFNKTRRVVGIGEIDNHKSQREFDGEKLDVFPYDWVLKTVTNHVLLNESLSKDVNKAKLQIINAFKNGRTYISFDYWDDPTEFSFEIEGGDSCVTIGGEMELQDGARLYVSLPEKAIINVLCDGKSMWKGEDIEAVLDITSPGVYRVEAYRNNLAWILSNPIWVKKAD